MKRNKNVLILEAGGSCGVSCIKLLKKNKGVKIIATDMSKYAAGLQMANIRIVVPPSIDEQYTRVIQQLVDKYKIDIVVPSYEHGYDKLRDVNAPFVMDFESAILCKDKLKFMNFCAKNGLPSPKTSLLKLNSKVARFPVFIKPRVGVGSRDNYVVNNAAELKKLSAYLDNSQEFLVQEFLQGDHWNVDVLVDEGKFITAVPRKDLVQKAGNCITVEVKNYKKLIKFSQVVQKVVGIKSPFNLEVFEVNPGKFVINEINVRFGGGIIFSAMAGVDMVSYLIDKDRSNIKKIREGIFTRYYEEQFVNLTKISF